MGQPEALRVVIAGGGTGGHLYPGIAVAREIASRLPASQISFVGTSRGIESRVVPLEGFPLDLIRSRGLKGKSARLKRVEAKTLRGVDAQAESSRGAVYRVEWPVVKITCGPGFQSLMKKGTGSSVHSHAGRRSQ